MKYGVYARIVGSKYIGTFEADSPQQARDKAFASNATHISFCHQCSEECEDPEIERLDVEIEDD